MSHPVACTSGCNFGLWHTCSAISLHVIFCNTFMSGSSLWTSKSGTVSEQSNEGMVCEIGDCIMLVHVNVMAFLINDSICNLSRWSRKQNHTGIYTVTDKMSENFCQL